MNKKKGFQKNDNRKLKKSGIRRLIQIYFVFIIQALIFFASAGHLNIPRAWLYFIVYLVCLLLNTIMVYKFFPEIANVRGEMRSGTKSWDKVFIALSVPMTLIIMPVVAGLDIGRYYWSSLPIYFIVIGIGLYIISIILIDWSLITNRYFETTVRIQKDRGHQVITTGPYKIVRHPGYVGIILSVLSFSLIIGSLFSLISAGIIILLFIARTSLEDKTLHIELDGYPEYAKRVKYRLFPGIW